MESKRMTQGKATSSLFIGVFGCWRAVLGFRDIFGYFLIFHPNVLHMFYKFSDVLHSTNEKVRLNGLKTVDK
jgi:hypothetical protein